MAAPTGQERIEGLMLPMRLFYKAVKSETILKRNRRLSEIREEAFAQFWNLISGPPPDPNQPLEGSAALVPPLLAMAKGDVLELGPGNGTQIQYFKAAADAHRIFGAEPCVPLHKSILANAQKHGLASKYSIINAGAEKESLIPGIAKAGLLTDINPERGLFDTIVCVRVLCSVVDLHETCDVLYKLLKPDGRLLVCEHTVNPWRTPKGSYLARLLQTILSLLGWPFFVGNCHLTRDIRKGLIGAAASYGGWKEVDLANNFGWAALPYVSGTLTK